MPFVRALQVEKMLNPLKAIRTQLGVTLGDCLPDDFGELPQAESGTLL